MRQSSTDSDNTPDPSLNETALESKRVKCYGSEHSSSNHWVLQDVTGNNIPTIEDLHQVIDASNGMMYMYKPAETTKKGCSLFVFNPLTMKVDDLSNRLQYRKRRSSIVTDTVDSHEKKKFPMIDFPSLAIIQSGTSKFLAVIGGYIYTDEIPDGEPNNKLFLIDVTDQARPHWWCQKVEGRAQPRLDATAIVVDNRVYLFGGVDRPNGPTEEPGVHLRSYSILEHDWDIHRWKWIVSDVPYPPQDVPEEINFGHGVPVFFGGRLLLFPSRKMPSFEATFTKKNIFYFDTKYHTFELARIMTEDINLPCSLSFFSACSYIPPPNNYPPGSTTQYLNFSPQKRRLLYTPITSAESVIICGWQTTGIDHDHLVPEMWRFFLFPCNRIVCLSIEAANDLIQQPAQFYYFALIGSSIYFLGSADDEDQLDRIDSSDKLLDVCLELTIHPD
ncbi:hypothetical protein JR316_0003912 [Psilocybe cubensis]|uniref:Uncharacterized protein n=2 Tax=Psilocybe cubensis TaxID=181762 RepID=A0ACB8HBA3_PSICU|nr:hypothetical protein JR316_0003912 [Psilocybe cubensis]KAH9484430.1 hypothetical protein JR316_0003912 [Psilocybe cubensis]